MRIKLSHSFCLFHESQGSSFLVAAHSIVPLPLWLAHLGPWHRGATVGTRPISSKSQQGVGGHSQWWHWEPILVMPGVVNFSILESAPTPILSHGDCVPSASGFLLFLGFAICKVGRPALTSQVHRVTGGCG